MIKSARLALIKSRAIALRAVSLAPAAFHPVPAGRHAPDTCGGVKFRTVPATPIGEPFSGLAPDVPEFVSDWRPVNSLPASIQRWVSNGFSVGPSITLP